MIAASMACTGFVVYPARRRGISGYTGSKGSIGAGGATAMLRARPWHCLPRWNRRSRVCARDKLKSKPAVVPRHFVREQHVLDLRAAADVVHHQVAFATADVGDDADVRDAGRESPRDDVARLVGAGDRFAFAAEEGREGDR